MLINIIQPHNFSLQTIRDEIARATNTVVEKIVKIEYWQHTLWVNVTGRGARLMSYRILPAWLQQLAFAIRDCTNLDQLWNLGCIFNTEFETLSQYYTEEYKQELRVIWADQRDYLRAEWERTRPMREHQQKAQEWLETWQKMISHCQNINSLQYLYPEMEKQSQEFADIPEIIPQLLTIFRKKSLTFSDGTGLTRCGNSSAHSPS